MVSKAPNCSAVESPSTSSEEADLLSRSTNHIKEVISSSMPPISKPNEGDTTMSDVAPAMVMGLSFKEKLMDSANPLNIDINLSNGMVDADSDSDCESECDIPVIRLSRNDKAEMRAPWRQSIIVKTFGSKVGYKFLYPRVKAQWKPIGKFECIDIGDDFFVFRFGDFGDYNRVLSGGPWFVGSHFLTVREWEPMFSTSTATTTTTAVWAQLSRLPLDCYTPKMLDLIGQKLGKPLRVDVHTSSNLRASFARICVQIDLNRPLIRQIKIGKHLQKVQYEGISALCFSCGCIGHRADECRMKVLDGGSTLDLSTPVHVPLVPQIKRNDEIEDGFGSWTLVQPKFKKSHPRYQRQNRGQTNNINNYGGKQEGAREKPGMAFSGSNKKQGNPPMGDSGNGEQGTEGRPGQQVNMGQSSRSQPPINKVFPPRFTPVPATSSGHQIPSIPATGKGGISSTTAASSSGPPPKSNDKSYRSEQEKKSQTGGAKSKQANAPSNARDKTDEHGELGDKGKEFVLVEDSNKVFNNPSMLVDVVPLSKSPLTNLVQVGSSPPQVHIDPSLDLSRDWPDGGIELSVSDLEGIQPTTDVDTPIEVDDVISSRSTRQNRSPVKRLSRSRSPSRSSTSIDLPDDRDADNPEFTHLRQILRSFHERTVGQDRQVMESQGPPEGIRFGFLPLNQ